MLNTLKNWKTYLVVKGKTDDLLSVSPDGTIKMTRMFLMPEQMGDPETEETLDVSITSVNMNLDHRKFDGLLGKNIRVTIDIEDDNLGDIWWDCPYQYLENDRIPN